jgi:predicted heme/steroid binding protein
MAEQRPVHRAELKRNNGDRGRPKYVAFEGRVYDVTDCPKWRGYMHEGLHFPGQDLTTELPQAPHANEVFEWPCVRYVGPLFESSGPG